MTEKTCWESFKVDGRAVVDKVKEIVHEGNVRRVVVRHDGRTLVNIPLTAGVVGALIAPELAALGAIVALLKECTIEIERVESTVPRDAPRAERA